jgi:hypothetical protein
MESDDDQQFEKHGGEALDLGEDFGSDEEEGDEEEEDEEEQYRQQMLMRAQQ